MSASRTAISGGDVDLVLLHVPRVTHLRPVTVAPRRRHDLVLLEVRREVCGRRGRAARSYGAPGTFDAGAQWDGPCFPPELGVLCRWQVAFDGSTNDGYVIRTDWDLAPKARLSLTKYLSLFVGKHRQRCRRLCGTLHRQVHSQLNSGLRRELRERLYAALHRALFVKLFETLFEKTLASLLGSMFESNLRSFLISTCAALHRQGPRGRQPVGRGVGGRIVVEF